MKGRDSKVKKNSAKKIVDSATNETSGLHVVTAPTKAPRVRKPKEEIDFSTLGVVSQVRIALRPANRVSLALGAFLGGVVPSIPYCVAHMGIDSTTPTLLLIPYIAIVCGALLFSAPTVFDWTTRAFNGSKGKAFGFVVLLEAALITPMPETLHYLPAVCLAYLVFINSVATGTKLALGK